MSDYKINLRFSLIGDSGTLYVKCEGDKAKASGFTRDVHGWGAEIHLLHLIRKKLEQAGIMVARKRVQGDNHFCHLYGDNYMCYLRTPIKGRSNLPHFWIIDGEYAVRSSADDYNAGNEVRFMVQGDIFQKRDCPPLQPDWKERLKKLCDDGGIDCEIKQSTPAVAV